MKILICDDSMTIRKKLTNTILEIVDCEILEAKDGQLAVTSYKDNQPDLVFMDIIMPTTTGLEATEEILIYDKNAKIIMLSSVGTKENLHDALNFGALDFIQKPFDKERIEQIISKYIGKE